MGAKFHPPNLGGMGCQGAVRCMIYHPVCVLANPFSQALTRAGRGCRRPAAGAAAMETDAPAEQKRPEYAGCLVYHWLKFKGNTIRGKRTESL